MSLDLVQGAALMLALCWLLSVSARYWQGRPLWGQVITGMVFGSICAVGMLTPVVLIPGVLLDTRTVVIGMASLFGGPWVGGMAMLITAGVRVWVGGAGMTAGILGLVLPLLLGLVFRAAVSKGFVKRSARAFFVFGLLVQAGGLLLYTTLTRPETQPTLEIVLLFLGVLPVVTVLLGLLLRDIEERTNTSAALQQSESRLRAIAAAVPDMLLVIDEDGRYLDVVSARRMPLYADFPGAKQWVGKRVEDVLPPDDAALFRGLVHRALRTSVPQLLEHSMKGADSLRTFEILANRLEYEHAGKQAAVLVMRDITMRRTAEEQIRTLALYDPLTGLPNRSFLLARLPLARRESARTRRFSALLSIDLDDFGSLNDTHGNLAGDRMLQRVAQCLLPVLPLGATPVRWGADEFVLLLEGLSANEEEAAADAARAAQRVVEAIALTAADDVLSYKVSACVGIALFRDAGESDNPMRRATLALYAAKDAGKGQIRIYDPVIQDATVARLALEASIRLGLLGGEFVIHYQPQLNNAGTITGVEALVRWQHPQRGLLYPGAFLAAAERAGLMDELDTQVLTDACSQLSQWSQKPAMRNLVISVNISAFQMGRNEFPAEVMAIIAKTGANTSHLKLELTETALVKDMSLATLSMASLRKQGVSFALDDFGTGYSSMSYLQRLPLDQLKIDQSFVKGLPHDNGSVAIVRAIVALSTNFGFEVLAEGVENQAQRDMLEAEGCHQYQGHLFHRAMPAADLELLITRSAAPVFAL